MLTRFLQDAGGWNALRRAIWAIVIKALPAVYGLGTLVTLIPFLPLEEFGRYGIVIAYINFTAMCSWGLWAVALVRSRPGVEREGVIGPVAWLMLSTGVLSAALSLFILPAIHIGFEASLWVAVIVVAFVPRGLAFALAQADGNSAAALWIDGTYYVGSLVGFSLLAVFGKLDSLVAVLQIVLAATVLSVIASILYYGTQMRIRTHGNWRAVATCGSWTGAQALGEVYMQQGDLLVIGAMIDPLRLAPYVAARALIRAYNVLTQSVNFVVLPVASRLAAEGDFAKLRRKLRSAFLALWTILLPLNVLLFWLADRLVPLILGAKYASSVPYFKIVLGATFFEPMYSIMMTTMVGMGRARKVALLVWGMLLANVVANIVLVLLFEMDAVPWIMVATYAALSIGFTIILRRELASHHSS